MKVTTKQITITAVLLAISIASQFFKSMSVYITGPIINACLILAVLSVGIGCGMILAVITPVTAFLIAGNPIMAAIPAIIPCIMVGNALLVLGVGLFYRRKQENIGIIAGMAVGTAAKALFMGVVISMILIPKSDPGSNGGENCSLSGNLFRDAVNHGADRKRLCICPLDSIKKGAGGIILTPKRISSIMGCRRKGRALGWILNLSRERF